MLRMRRMRCAAAVTLIGLAATSAAAGDPFADADFTPVTAGVPADREQTVDAPSDAERWLEATDRAEPIPRRSVVTDESPWADPSMQAPRSETAARDDAAAVRQTAQFAPAAAEQPPIPPAERPASPQAPATPVAESHSHSLNQIAPWNPAAPSGVCITPPGTEYPTVKVTGFFQADAVWFGQDDANIREVGDVPDGADFRRARLAATGDVWENVGYMVEVDFAAPGRPSLMDVYMDLRDMPWLPGTLRIGQWRMPFGMDSLTSVRELTFLERGLPFAFVPFRQIGIGLIDPVNDDNTTWQVAGFRYPTDVFGGNVGDDGGYSFAGRAAALLAGDEKGDDPLVHVGADYSYLNSSFDTFRFLNQPEVFVSETPGPVVPPGAFLNVPAFVDTGLLAAEQGNLFGAEIGGRSGSLWAQAEWYGMVLDRMTAANPFFWGAYAQVGYILTGEVRPYSKANGVFTRVVPNSPVKRGGGPGAWEIAGRWSTIDLNDAGVDGNRLTDFTAGLNWYLNTRTKIQFNYIHAFLDARRTGESDADILATRAQIDF